MMLSFTACLIASFLVPATFAADPAKGDPTFMDQVTDFGVRAKDATVDFVSNPVERIQEAANATWETSLGYANQLQETLPEQVQEYVSPKVTAGIGLAAVTGLVLYGVKKIYNFFFGSNSKMGWQCKCSSIKIKKKKCKKCGCSQPKKLSEWTCTCGPREADEKECTKCGDTQSWTCNCRNSTSLKKCKTCETKQPDEVKWKCKCEKHNKHKKNVEKCEKCGEKQPKKAMKTAEKVAKMTPQEQAVRAAKLAKEEEWLGIFPNKLSGLIIIGSGCVTILLGLVLATLFCGGEEVIYEDDDESEVCPV